MGLIVEDVVRHGQLPGRMYENTNFVASYEALISFLSAAFPSARVQAFQRNVDSLIAKLPPVKCDISDELCFRLGIEIEAEKCRYFEQNGFPVPGLWQTKSDGSLRNHGTEFISLALPAGLVAPVIATLYAYFPLCNVEPDFSFRSSTHVHVNCRQLPVESFKNLILLTLVLEDALFGFASPGRRDTNIFCTPLTRSNFYALSSFLSAPNNSITPLRGTLQTVSHNIKKYAALNFSRIWDLGTLEFRHLKGTSDPLLVVRWCQLIASLFQASCKLPTQVIYSAIKDLNTSSSYNNFLDIVFGEDLAMLLFSPSFAVRMSKNISVVKEIISGKEFTDSIEVSKHSGIMQLIAFETECKAKKDSLSRKKEI